MAYPLVGNLPYMWACYHQDMLDMIWWFDEMQTMCRTHSHMHAQNEISSAHLHNMLINLKCFKLTD